MVDKNIYISILIFFLFFLLLFKISFKNENFKNINNIELIISRYNENLEWLNENPFNKYPNIIYNKGITDNFIINKNTIITTKLKNVGRCDGTYLYHIIANYDNLSDITIFLPGSTNIDIKYKKAKLLIDEIEKHQDTVFIGVKYNNVKNDLYNFKIDEWVATDKNNSTINPESKLELANIRPFGAWFENKFNDLEIKFISYLGILGISKKDILKHPKSYYINLLYELENSSNPEVGHYFERSWEAIFYPFANPKYIIGI